MTAVEYLLSHIPEIGKDLIGRDIIEMAMRKERIQILITFNESQLLFKQNDKTDANAYYQNRFKNMQGGEE
jgi:hypothetical protein